MLDAMRRADRAYWTLLDAVEEPTKQLVGKDKKIVREELAKLKKSVEMMVTKFPLGISAKGALPYDVHAQASSFLELINVGQDASWPTRKPKEDPYPEALNLLTQAITLEELTTATEAMSSRPRSNDPRPLSIVRNDPRGTVLLEDDKARLFAWINLHGLERAGLYSPVTVANMVNTRNGEIVSFKRQSGDLFPLECSKWHYQRFIKEGQLQSSKLIYRKDSFYLACTFEFVREDIDCVTYLGIDRGIEEIASYAVISDDLKLLDQGSFEGSTSKGLPEKERS